jgi:hypothetical protein
VLSSGLESVREDRSPIRIRPAKNEKEALGGVKAVQAAECATAIDAGMAIGAERDQILEPVWARGFS